MAICAGYWGELAFCLKRFRVFAIADPASAWTGRWANLRALLFSFDRSQTTMKDCGTHAAAPAVVRAIQPLSPQTPSSAPRPNR
jgi:hypothetical protein